MVFNITIESRDPGVQDSTHATQTGYFATPIPGNSANPPYHEWYSNTNRPTSLGPVDPLAVPRLKYRHRRPRGNIERPDTHARAQRSPHRSRKTGDFTVHIASDSESRFAVDSDDEDEWTDLPYPLELRPEDSVRQQQRRVLRLLRAQCLLLESDLSLTEPGLMNDDIAEKIEKDLDGLIDLVRGLRVGNERAPSGGKAAEAEKPEDMSHIEQQEANSTQVWPERETTRTRGMTRAEQRRAIYSR